MSRQQNRFLVFIPPSGAGKGTIATLFARERHMHRVSMDTERHYYAGVGFHKKRKAWPSMPKG